MTLFDLSQARKNAKLFDDFCERIEAIQDDEPEGKEMGTKAVRLSAKIRNTHDELQMLRAIGKHQMRVWEKLKNGSPVDNDGRWESHVLSDIEDMIASADRVKSNVRKGFICGTIGFADFGATGWNDAFFCTTAGCQQSYEREREAERDYQRASETELPTRPDGQDLHRNCSVLRRCCCPHLNRIFN